MKQHFSPGDLVMGWDGANSDLAQPDIFLREDTARLQLKYVCARNIYEHIRTFTNAECVRFNIEIEVPEPKKPWTDLRQGDPCLCRLDIVFTGWEARVFYGVVDGKPATYDGEGVCTSWDEVIPFDPAKVGKVTED